MYRIVFLLILISNISAAQNVVWVKNYISGFTPAFDFAYDIAVDANGNSFVTGLSYAADTMGDIVTIKYNSVGDTVWVRRYNGPGDNWDHAYAMAIDASGNVYVAGKSFSDSADYDYTALKYNASGVQQWVRRFNGIGNTRDVASDMVIDKDANVYVTGSSGEGSPNLSDYLTVKYDTDGIEQWVASYSSVYDYAAAIAVDTSGNVYVTGHSYMIGTFYDYATVKYNTLGVEQWVRRHNGILNSDDMAYAITVDDSGNVYVTGEDGGIGLTDYATIKYNTNGTEQWVVGYNGPGNAVDRAFDIVVDNSGNVYVTGESDGGTITTNDYATIKYNASGVQVWDARYNSPGNKYDDGKALAVDSAGSIYVTGRSHDVNGGVITTIKYSDITVGTEELPASQITLQNYPNPVTNSTIFAFTISEPAYVILTIYDVFGKVVAMPLAKSLTPGNHHIEWKPVNLSEGLYFYRLATETQDSKFSSDVMKMLLLQNH